MPVELTLKPIRDALAVLQEHEPDTARDAAAVLESLGWGGEEPFLLRRYDVQVFAWFGLSHRWLVSLDDKRGLLEALARLLERLGRRAATYADVCRSPDTDALLEAYENEDPTARQRMHGLLQRSGLEPSDTKLLAWGSVMGLTEAGIREQVGIALEEAVEDGRLVAGSSTYPRHHAEVVNAALSEPWDDNAQLTRRDAIHGERIERWLRRGFTLGSPERQALVARAGELVRSEPLAIDTVAARDALAPTLWVLEQARDGIGLTQTGALNRTLVRDVVVRWPEWWDDDLRGPPHREYDVFLLENLHSLLRRLRLVRRNRNRLLATKRGTDLAADPAALLAVVGVELLTGTSFAAACAELAAVLVLDGATVDTRALATTIYPTILAEGWNAAGDPPAEHEVAWKIADFVHAAECVGVIERERPESRRSPVRWFLSPAGRPALAAGLRARAVAPATTP